jgi:multidrug efflux pump subunit AcrA (membrane-fusion protein)
MTAPHPVPEPEGEQEVDLASAWERLKARWWLPAIGLVAGAIVGLLLALSGGHTFEGKTLIYLGQPFAPLGGGQIVSLATNPRTVNEVVHSESALRHASRVSGVPVSRLRSSVSVKQVVAAGQTKTTTPLVEVGVKASGRAKAAKAADALANEVVRKVSVFVTDKVRNLEQQAQTAQAQLNAIDTRIQNAQQQQSAIVNDKSLSLETRLLLSANLNSVITTADARRSDLQQQLNDAQQLLNLAKNVEESRVVEPASGVRSSARSNRTALLVGGIIGLLIGAVVALAVEPIAARRRLRAATPE